MNSKIFFPKDVKLNNYSNLLNNSCPNKVRHLNVVGTMGYTMIPMNQYDSRLWQCELLFISLIDNLLPPTRANLVPPTTHLLQSIFHHFLSLFISFYFISTMELYSVHLMQKEWPTVCVLSFCMLMCWFWTLVYVYLAPSFCFCMLL